jgi:hypothetical protein
MSTEENCSGKRHERRHDEDGGRSATHMDRGVKRGSVGSDLGAAPVLALRFSSWNCHFANFQIVRLSNVIFKNCFSTVIQ